MDKDYQPQTIELETQRFWDEQQSFKAVEDLSREKFYCLAMFPYPSGQLHMGHVRNYTIADVIARYQRMRGKNVLQPMGWDAFGLPAENAAIQRDVLPANWTYQNIEAMRAQFKRLGFAYDWKREITTCKPEYYRWEQWLFTKLYEKGLAYRKSSWVNWDPVDQTVLANEQVINGRGWRSDALVERREIPQWFLKITAYAEELLNDLDKLSGWPEQVLTMQRNWIGRSEGALVYFNVVGDDDRLEAFTTRPDTLMGVTYIALAPQHPFIEKIAKNHPEVAAFVAECRHVPVSEAAVETVEKKGVDTGFKAVHPLTGEELPIWAANFVVMDYGTGAVMSVPAHDARDFEFARKYQLPIKPVIFPSSGEAWDFEQAPFIEMGRLVHSEQFDGLSSEKAMLAVTEFLTNNKKGKQEIQYRLRDWGISRQRYWGAPIPIIYCDDCGPVAVPEEDLPVVLPEQVEFSSTAGLLKSLPEFYRATCPHCKKPAVRETDTFDTFVESSWYYARFACKNQDSAMLDDRARYWTPVDTYVGGVEHAVMHLLYARFFHKVMRDLELINSDEPFVRLLTQGMVLKDGAKMSKSKGNVVDPQTLIDKYGADTVRLFIIFAAPPEQSLEWSDAGVEGAYRFLKKLWIFAEQCGAKSIRTTNYLFMNNLAPSIDWNFVHPEQNAARREIYEILKQARYDFERLQFNTVVSAGMKIFNLLTKLEIPEPGELAYLNPAEIHEHLLHEGISILLRLLAPIVPHICHYLWCELGYEGLIIDAKLPKVVTAALIINEIEIAVQVNGKLRAQVEVPADADATTMEQVALANEKIQKFISGQVVKKVICVPGKLVNIVLT